MFVDDGLVKKLIWIFIETYSTTMQLISFVFYALIMFVSCHQEVGYLCGDVFITIIIAYGIASPHSWKTAIEIIWKRVNLVAEIVNVAHRRYDVSG